MTLPASGIITLNNVRAEAGVDYPIRLDDPWVRGTVGTPDKTDNLFSTSLYSPSVPSIGTSKGGIQNIGWGYWLQYGATYGSVVTIGSVTPNTIAFLGGVQINQLSIDSTAPLGVGSLYLTLSVDGSIARDSFYCLTINGSVSGYGPGWYQTRSAVYTNTGAKTTWQWGVNSPTAPFLTDSTTLIYLRG